MLHCAQTCKRRMSLSRPLFQICALKYFAPDLVGGRLRQQRELEEELYGGETALGVHALRETAASLSCIHL